MGSAAFPTGLAITTLVLLAMRPIRADGVAVLALCAAVLGGVVPLDRALAGFADPVIVTVGALTVLATAVLRSGLVDAPRAVLARRWRRTTPVLLGSGLLIALLAALAGRVGTRAALRRAARLDAAGSENRPALLLDLACFLGGLMTIVGSVPNLLVATIRADTLGEPFDVLAFLPVGGLLLAVGLLLFAPLSLLTNRRGAESAEGPSDQLRRVQSFVAEVMLPPGFPFAGRSVAAFEAAGEHNFRVRALVREGFRRIEAAPGWLLEPGDIVALDCQPSSLHRMIERFGLQPADGKLVGAANLASVTMVEAVVTQSSSLLGKPAGAIGPASRAGAHLLGLGRNDHLPHGRLRRAVVRAGDIVILAIETDAAPPALAALGCLLLAERRLRLGRRRLAALPAALLLAALFIAALGVAPLWFTLLCGVLLLVLSTSITVAEAYEHVPWPGLVMLACLLPLAAQLHDSAAAEAAARLVAPAASSLGTLPAACVALAVAMAATLLLGGAAAVLLLAPFAVALAGPAGLSADMLLMAVAVGASFDIVGGRTPTAALVPALGRVAAAPWRAAAPVAAGVLLFGTLAVYWAWRP